MKRTHRSLSKRLLLAAGIIVLVLAVGAGRFSGTYPTTIARKTRPWRCWPRGRAFPRGMD